MKKVKDNFSCLLFNDYLIIAVIYSRQNNGKRGNYEILLRILKNDLSRRKVTNIILLLFITMAAMFVSGSVNSIITIMSAQGDYFDKAGMYDSITMLRDAPDGDILEKEAQSFEYSGGFIRESHLVLPASGIKKHRRGV